MFLVERNESNPFSLSVAGKLCFLYKLCSVARVGAGHFSVGMSGTSRLQGQECSYFRAWRMYVQYSRSAL